MLTRETILKLDMTGKIDMAICQHCGDTLEIPFPFVPYTYVNGKRQRVRVKNRGQLLMNFTEQHWGRYMLSLVGKK
jgi:uncharacterized OB-fold protein